jgi:nucleoside-diphosphate-sugar epimerase
VHFVRDHHDDDSMSALEHVYTMQQLLNFFWQLQQQEKKKKRVPHFVYISSTRDKDGALTTMTSAVDMLTKTFSNVHGTTATTVGLRLPLVYGDYVENSILSNKIMMMLQGDNVTTTTTTTTTQEDEQVVLFVEDAVHAIVAAMQIQPPTGLVTLDVSNSAMTMKMLQQQVEAILVSKHQNSSSVAAATTTIMTTTDALTRYWLGWTPTTSIQQGASKLLSLHLAHKFPFGTVEPTLHVPTPPQRVEFPCASECARPASCALSVFDKTIKVSRPLTRGCKYAVYTVDLWGDLQDLPSSGQPSEDVSEENKWCRIAFVSSQSPLVQEVVVMQVGNHTTTSTSTVNRTLIETHSGKVQYKNWTLVFVHGNAANMSEAEYTLLKLTPKRFFSETVSRAMFVQPNRFPVPPFESLSGFFKSLDPSAKAAGRTKEYRAGVNSIFRFLPKEAKKARRVIFSSLEATFPNVPEKSPIGVYVQDLCKREGIRPNQDLLVPQVSFYTYAAHFVQNGIRRPEYEIRSTIYKGGFPFEWLKTAMIVHDLRETEARDLRCEWYDEHLFWGNTHLEDVSLAYVLGKRRIMGRVGVAPESEQGWFPIMDTDAVGETADEVMLPNRLTNADDAELFVRILPKPKS